MSQYPASIDNDESLPRVSDSITETGAEAINAARDAILAIQEELGVNPAGSAGSVADRLDVSLNADGTLKTSALISVALATLPITNSQVASNAGIEESKLNLNHSTTDLFTLISSNSSLLSSISSYLTEVGTNLNLHTSGTTFLSDGISLGRHVLSQIDLNATPSDSRDALFVWTGLLDKDGNQRVASNAAEGLLAINDALTSHENQAIAAHQASAIEIDTSSFVEIPSDKNSVQKAIDYLDQADVLNLGQHRATQHANAIAKISRSYSFEKDGYGSNVVPVTSVLAYLVEFPNTSPVDDLSIGDDIIKFVPDNSDFSFDAKFSQVKIGDIVRINYGNGLEASYPVESIRYVPGSEWIIRVNGVNLCSSADGYAEARIDKPLYDEGTHGIFAVAEANANNASGPVFTNFLSSLIVSDPKAASVLGLGFNANQLNSNYYNLYLELYPTGNPEDRVISLPAIDVTGNAGATPGKYTLESVIFETNKAFRRYGYNYRFIAYSYNGEFGIKLADSINNASFAVILGDNSSGTLLEGIYTNNVISTSDFDALGFGPAKANIASPAYLNSWSSVSAALIPTRVISPLKQRYAIVNGKKVDTFAATYLANDEGYWDGYISARNVIGASSVETTYTINLNLAPAGLKEGKTIIVQPEVSFNDALYDDVDYGRFIIKSVNFISACNDDPAYTQITVINSIHGNGSSIATSGDIGLPVRLYFSYDSVAFDNQNLIDDGFYPTDYKRLYEVYVDESGKTFSHERARLPVQTEGANTLATTNWHIVDVSPKLRGYTDGIVTTFNKYLRLYIANYDAAKGTFEASLGKRVVPGSSVIKLGQEVLARKNQKFRVYDETNVDYIELIFVENASSPGINVLSSGTARYVDIELFDSLKLNDELMLLATCEVNWDPASGENIIQFLSDKRQFGSIDEIDFTDSAKNYINLTNKYLSTNGIISGLDFDSISATPNSGEIFYKGGIALVNGKIITVNNSSCVIPQIRETGTSLPQTVEYAICVNEYGQLVPLLLVDESQQYFATPGSGNYFVDSYTFANLLLDKRFAIIDIANVTIASLTINFRSDARKFIVNNFDNINLTLSWSPDGNMIDNDGNISNFRSFEALKNHIVKSNYKKCNVILRGNINLYDDWDLTGFEKKVKFVSDNATINSSFRILIDSNIEFDGVTFNYEAPAIAYEANNNITSSYGCLYSVPENNKENIVIQNCVFNCSGTTQRPPFVNLELQRGGILDNVKILNNKFNDEAASLLGTHQAAIVISRIYSGSSSDRARISNLEINNNTCSDNQGIYITLNNASAPTLTCRNVIISNNDCGTIGFISGRQDSNIDSRSDGIIVSNNRTSLIAPILGDGKTLLPSASVSATGKQVIKNNNAHWITAYHRYADPVGNGIIISENFLDGYDPSYLSFYGISNNYGISFVDFSGGNGICSAIIKDNIFNDNNYYDSNYKYDRAVYVAGSAEVSSNSIRGMDSPDGYGIFADVPANSGTAYVDIHHNKIYRNNYSIYAYVFATYSNNLSGDISFNYFDSETIDGSSTDLIKQSNNAFNFGTTRFSYKNNVNQNMIYLYTPASGVRSKLFALGASTITDYNIDIAGNFTATFTDAGTDPDNGRWYFPLHGILPFGAKLLSIEYEFQSTAAPGSSSIQTTIQNGTASTYSDTSSIWNTSLTQKIYNITSIDASNIRSFPLNSLATVGYSHFYIRVLGSGAGSITIRNVFIKYTF